LPESRPQHSPWQSSPGFLERAQAALTPPEGRILHASWTVTRTSRDYGCTVTLGPNELWADLSTPYRYRLIAVFPSADAVDRRSAACDKNQTNTTEVGGTPNASFRFVPPDMFAPNGPGWTGESQDDVPLLREALAEGRAYDEGQAQLDGRVVERIRVYLGTGHSHPRYYYVDRKTFIPVQVEDPDGMLFSTARLGDLRFDIVRHYLTYEYLPRTDHNLDFTDIWAQHP
jgi:hypothetical protein